VTDEVRSLASLLAADLSEWGVGAEGYHAETGEVACENARLARWCEWAPKVVLAAIWPEGAEEVLVHCSVVENVEHSEGRESHARVYTADEVFGEDGVIALAVTSELWEPHKLASFIEWALVDLYPQYLVLTGKHHRCRGRLVALDHHLAGSLCRRLAASAA